MSRHTVKYDGLPGVEFCENDNTLYVDLPAYVAQSGDGLGGHGEGSLIFFIVNCWRSRMPAYQPRAYAIRGVLS